MEYFLSKSVYMMILYFYTFSNHLVYDPLSMKLFSVWYLTSLVTFHHKVIKCLRPLNNPQTRILSVTLDHSGTDTQNTDSNLAFVAFDSSDSFI